jgi:capsule polysaccharide modification protein KpsS
LFLIKKKIQSLFLNRCAKIKINQDEKFVYFPLQLEPERTLLIPAPFYSNQLEVIFNIAKSLPIDFKLYIKEHPMQIVYGWRSISFYKKILELPNVVFIHPNFSNKTLLKKCQVLITITGTLGLEASFYGKPSITLSNTIYSELPSVSKLTNYEELSTRIKESVEQKVNIDDVNLFVNKIINNSFEFEGESLLVLFNNEFYYGGFLFDNNVSVEKVGRFLDKYKEFFEKLADEHIEKINQYQSDKII